MIRVKLFKIPFFCYLLMFVLQGHFLRAEAVSNDGMKKIFIDYVCNKAADNKSGIIDDTQFIEQLEGLFTPEYCAHILRVGPNDFVGLGIREILAGFIASELDVVFNVALSTQAVVNTVDSRIDTVDSKIDFIQITSDTILSKVCVIDSKLDNLNFDFGPVETVVSKVDILEGTSEAILSKVCVVDSKIDEINMGINPALDSKVDILQGTSDTILSKVCVVDSKLDNLNIDLGPIQADFASTWTILQAIEGKVCCLAGNTITQNDVGTAGFTISVPGAYRLCENIIFSPLIAAAAITISADNVSLDLNNKTISQGNLTSGVLGIVVDMGHTGIAIHNGSIVGMSDSGIQLMSGNDDINIDGLIVNECGDYGLTATLVDSLIIKNDEFSENINSGMLISSCNKVCIVSTVANSNGGDGFELVGTGNYYVVQDCKALNNTNNGFNMVNLFDSVLRNSIAIGNGGNGIILNNAFCITVNNNTSSKNGSNGLFLSGSVGSLECYLSNNTLVKNAGVNLFEASSSGLNSILGNFAQNPTLARNYCAGLSAITTVTLRQSVPFISSPTPWDNINMIP